MLRPRSLTSLMRIFMAMAGDMLVACGAVAAVVTIRTHVDVPLTRTLLPHGKFPLDVTNLLIFSLSAAVALALSGFYNFRVSPRHRPTLFVALPLQMGLVAIAGTLFQHPWPRTVFFAVPLVEAVLIPAWRTLMARFWREETRTTALVGRADDLLLFLPQLPEWLTVTGLITIDCPVGHPLFAGRLGEEHARAVIQAAEEVIDLGGADDGERRLRLLEICGPRGFLCTPAPADAMLTTSAFGTVGEHLLVEVSMPGAWGVGGAAKRVVDLLLGTVGLLVAFPLMAVIALVVAIDSRGPVLLRQRRAGQHGRPFLMWKFRTMHANHSGTGLALDRDARVTRSGRWLRRYRLDELPQLFNIVSGDMSMIGPRPEIPERVDEIARAVPYFRLRLYGKPGLAGLAQTEAEYDQSSRVKLTYDLQYLCSWSPVLDLSILIRAIVTALSGRGV